MSGSYGQSQQVLDLMRCERGEQLQAILDAADLINMMKDVAFNLQHVDREAFKRVLQVEINPYEDQCCTSSYTYPPVYRPRPVAEQLQVLAGLYPALNADHVESLAAKLAERQPEGAELIQVWPKLKAVGRATKVKGGYYEQGYATLVVHALFHLAASRTVRNYQADRLTEGRVRLLQAAMTPLKRIESQTPGDFNVTWMQSGCRWAGSSVQRSRWAMAKGGVEVPAMSWLGLHHLLTHPARLGTGSELWLDLPGDEVKPDAEAGWGYASCLDFCGGAVRFGCHRVGGFNGLCGSASFFLPE